MTQSTTAVATADRLVWRRETDPDPDTLERWDRFVEFLAGADVTQLSGWSAIRSRSGFSALYLLAYDGDTLAGGCLILRRRLLGVLPICYVSYGPLVDRSRTDAGLIVGGLSNELASLAKSSAMTFVQPPEGADDFTEHLLHSGFRLSDAQIAPAGSYRLDLTRSLVEIRGGFSKRLKSWTNRWEAKGVSVRQGDDRDLPILAALVVNSAVRQGFTPPSPEYLGALYSELAPRGHAALFIGEVEGRPVAADLVTMIGDTVQGRRCGFDSSGPESRFSVPAAVRWEIIKWAKREGYRWLDFGGLPGCMLDDMLDRGVHASDEWPSAHRAKLSFGGLPFRYPAPVESVRPFPLRWAYDVARRSTQGKHLIDGVRASLKVSPAEAHQSRLTDNSRRWWCRNR